MTLVFLYSFRRLSATLLPLMEVGACLVFVFGLMGWLGVPVYLTTAVMPVILTAMGVSDEVYIFKRYVELLREHPGNPHHEAVSRAMKELWRPILSMAATTAIGFLSFALSSVKPVQMFGLFTAVGIVFCVLWSLLVIPAMLVLLKPGRLVPRERAAGRDQARSDLIWRGFGRWVLAHRRAVLAATLVVVALTPLGIRRVVVQDSWIDGFDPDSDFRQATRLVNEQFHGAHLLRVVVDAGHTRISKRVPWAMTNDYAFPIPAEFGTNHDELLNGWLVFTGNAHSNIGPTQATVPAAVWRSWIQSVTNRDGEVWVSTPKEEGSPRFWLQPLAGEPVDIEFISFAHLRPDLLHRIDALGRFIAERRTNAVGGVVSAADYVATTRFMVRNTETNSHQIPATPQLVKTLWDHYRMARGPERLRQTVDTNYAKSVLTIFMKDANFVGTARLMRDIRDYERRELAPHGIRLSFGGDVAVSQSLIERIVSTQVWSLGSSLAGIFVIVLVLGRSVRGGIYCVVPSLLAVALNFAVMGWVGMPLGVATSMFAGMTLGMGVDFAIHLLERFQFARAAGGGLEGSVVEALRSVGPAVVINALGVALGFGILLLSQVPANARLGALVVLGVVNCLGATLLLLPVLFAIWPPRAPG
jgi:predicted RND superfamily exporter protein